MKRWIVTLCGVLGACSGELPPASRVDKLRVLAVRAEPPEVKPGAETVLDALVVQPPVENGGMAPVVSYLWLACIEAAGASSPTACGVTAGGNGGADAFAGGAMGIPDCGADPGATLCLLGENASVKYRPGDAAIGCTGVGTVIVTAIVADQAVGGAIGCAMAAAGNGGAPTDPDHCVIALKRVTVSRSDLPNGNPTLSGFTLGGGDLGAAGVMFSLAPSVAMAGVDPALELKTERVAGSAEVKRGRKPDCNSAEMPDGTYEPLFVSWFATAGGVKESRSSMQKADCTGDCLKMDIDMVAGTRWTPPTAEEAMKWVHGGEVDFWVVVRDDRGGVGWKGGKALVR